MIRKLRFILNVTTVLLVFSLSALSTMSAFADDTVPPPVDPTIEIPPPIDEPVTMPPAPEQPSEETEALVMSTSAEPVPLAVKVKTPRDTGGGSASIWCPAGVAPKATAGGCSIEYNNLSDLAAGGSHAANGTIWINLPDDTGTQAVFDGTPITGNWASAANFSLTLQGGWNGVPLSKTIVGVTSFDTAISIYNWNGAVTVNDLALQGAANSAYPGSGALYVNTKKNIALSNVTVVNTGAGGGDGAELDNSASTTQATITVKNSSFNNNIGWGGLTISSSGAVTLTNVNASFNDNYGALISNANDSIASAITINNSTFNSSLTGEGLIISSNGAVKLNQVTANKNGDIGVFVNNGFAPSAQAVTVTGFLNAINNGGSGLEIYSKGAVTLTNLTTNVNGDYGTYIDNTYGTGATAVQAVNITGANVFSDNYYANGLYIASRGTITLNNITAIWNGRTSDDDGVYIHNDYDTAKPQNITLNGYNFFLHNGHHGLNAVSYGAITVNNVTAADNGYTADDSTGTGVILINNNALITKPANITVNGTNSFTYSDGYGIAAYSLGVITFSNITASNNGMSGAYLANYFSGTNKAVLLKGSNYFNQNGGAGLDIYSRGTITINNVTAYYNGGHGVYLNNVYGFQSAIAVNGYGLFDWNANDGLHTESNGAITTSNLNANHNGGNGASLSTKGILAPQAVTLKGNNNFNFNGNSGTDSGLVILSDGAITVNNINANYNYSNGAYLDNFTNWDAPAVNFKTFGSVTITGFGNFTANGNASSTTTPTIAKRNEGLYVYTHGAVTLNYITSSFNTFNDGIGIDADGNATLVCSSANNNGWGIYIYTAPIPVLTLKGFIAVGNSVANETLNFVTLVRSRCP